MEKKGIRQLADFTGIIYRPNEGYEGFVHIQKKASDGSWKLVRCIRSTELPDFFSTEFFFDRRSEYYITANSFRTHEGSAENLFTLYSIVIDIDIHGDIDDDAREALLERAAWISLGDIAECGRPNVIVRTGRGLQLWYAIRPVPYGAEWKYRLVSEYICSAYRAEIQECGLDLQGVEVDQANSCSPSALKRLPGSYNAAVRRDGTLSIVHDGRLDIDEYADSVSLEKIRRQAAPRIPAGGISAYACAQRRENALLDLIDLRHGECEGYRDKMLFILYCIWGSVLGTHAEIMEHLSMMNSIFREPLDERTIESSMVSADRKRYRIRNDTIIAWLDMTPAEQDLTGLHPRSERETLREEKRKAKAERNAEIILLHEAGIKNRDIAVAVGCSPQTVGRVLAA